MNEPRCFQVAAADNVATMLADVTSSPSVVTVLGADKELKLQITEPIKLGHKIAVCQIKTGEPVVKFAVPIGRATADIQSGQWVHLHNCSSNFDERSQTLDVHTGATTDTKYE